MNPSRTALVLGATGGAGYEIAGALHRRGWQIRALSRRPDYGQTLLPYADWLRGDAMNAADVADAAINAELIVHAVNPPGYRNWQGLALPMLENTIAAAKATGARIMFPGTVYNYGPDVFPLLKESDPQTPRTRKGAIRVEMEQRLQHAAGQGTRVLIVRAGDFFGPHSTGNSWFSQGLVKSGKPVTSVMWPGRKGVGHAWAYLPDYGEAVARLIDRDREMSAFETFHFDGHWFEDGREFADAIRFAAGAPDAPVRGFPWFVLLALSPFVSLFRELAEMKYLWDVPVRLDNRKLTDFLGEEPHTPLHAALSKTLEKMDCLPSTAQTRQEFNLRDC
ncbi:NAD-dependent epimerase/dehydratase family protein [Hyphomonas jannaschiana]|uniref:NAD-dependent epimerase/dehydratase n=1 Tax=Hyphomonas jannaschiana VP2 TaxID=1280952 RepID=A0A059FDE9_9PROT|nr:NAD-dependent epimerase/dehydratase family protein [Hyphomonas jannaschiana]KCZ88523.1 NAD-dependent epimerase/dehydratase [Hyphomonas jannaschiana VP2]